MRIAFHKTDIPLLVLAWFIQNFQSLVFITTSYWQLFEVLKKGKKIYIKYIHV